MVRKISAFICFLFVFGIPLSDSAISAESEKRCRNPPTAPQKIERVITLCQDEIKLSILREALDVIKDEHTMPQQRKRNKREVPFTHDEKRIAGCLLQCVYRKVKAELTGKQAYRSPDSSGGSIGMQAVSKFKRRVNRRVINQRSSKNKQLSMKKRSKITQNRAAAKLGKSEVIEVDGYGFPTLEGLVGLYSDGVNERGYFMAVLEASRECLMRNHDKFSRTVPMDNGRNCDVSFDIFECISDRIGEYCGNSGL